MQRWSGLGGRDLRRQALESSKTVSRKKRNKEEMQSRDSSAANSRTHSTNVSRQGSDADDDDTSEGTNMSIASLEDDLFSVGSEDGDEDEDSPEEWKVRLRDRMEEMKDRKRSSVQGRETTLASYGVILRSHFALDQIKSSSSELVNSMLKSIKMEASERETCLALRALEATILTLNSDTIYESVYSVLNVAYKDSESLAVKTAAINALGTAAVYGGASEDTTSSIMDELMEVIESDGSSVEAEDSAEVVVAAIKAWANLAIDFEDMEDKSEEAMEVLVEQLESTYAAVQIAAGQTIALLFEKSYSGNDDDYESPSDSDDDDPERHQNRIAGLKLYDAYRDRNQLIHTLSTLAKDSSKSVSKKDRVSVRSSFNDILLTVEEPTRGPGYRTHFGRGGTKALGSGIIVRIHQKGYLKINKWWKLERLQALKRILGGGFLNHYEANEMVFDSLPIMVAGSVEKSAPRYRKQ
ncbi:IFRD-containing protein [Coleophoma crateriformis]|uniref:IFRD-containing protein n=1 Tax=Coleophoma crateriformis TaxID=565419 RepID=A0A3D8SYW6_9HELO|nr:IFRD-containing protein [Coleophoma crateriformis]